MTRARQASFELELEPDDDRDTHSGRFHEDYLRNLFLKQDVDERAITGILR